jgi:hypothetical protein
MSILGKACHFKTMSYLTYRRTGKKEGLRNLRMTDGNGPYHLCFILDYYKQHNLKVHIWFPRSREHSKDRNGRASRDRDVERKDRVEPRESRRDHDRDRDRRHDSGRRHDRDRDRDYDRSRGSDSRRRERSRSRERGRYCYVVSFASSFFYPIASSLPSALFIIIGQSLF